MTWGDSYNGGPSHRGICPECDRYNGTCYDDLCESCLELQPVKCPKCGDLVDSEFMTEHGVCTLCADENAKEFAIKFEVQLK